MQRVSSVKSLLPSFREAITAIKETPSHKFRLIKSYPPRPVPFNRHGPGGSKTVCILDSSFNPPTKAHMHMAIQALHKYTPKDTTLQNNSIDAPQLLLLLATSNVDKTEVPAPYEQRMAMMCLLAEEIRDVYTTEIGGTAAGLPQIDIGITLHAKFADKSEDMATHKVYPKDETKQVWIIGFDTFTRLLDTKYYAPHHTLEPVYNTLLSGNNRVLVFLRPSEEFGSEQDQKTFVETKDPIVAAKSDFIVADEKKTEGVSSTKVRKGSAMDLKSGNSDTGGWTNSVCSSVAQFIQDGKLYQTD